MDKVADVNRINKICAELPELPEEPPLGKRWAFPVEQFDKLRRIVTNIDDGKMLKLLGTSTANQDILFLSWNHWKHSTHPTSQVLPTH